MMIPVGVLGSAVVPAVSGGVLSLQDLIESWSPDFYWPCQDTAIDTPTTGVRAAGYNGKHQWGNHTAHAYGVTLPGTTLLGQRNTSRYARSSTLLVDSTAPPSEATFFGIHHSVTWADSGNGIAIPGRWGTNVSYPGHKHLALRALGTTYSVLYGGSNTFNWATSGSTWDVADAVVIRCASDEIVIDSYRYGQSGVSVSGWLDPTWDSGDGVTTWSMQSTVYEHERIATTSTQRNNQYLSHNGVLHRLLDDTDVADYLAAFAEYLV
jgi:hypothetical protein